MKKLTLYASIILLSAFTLQRPALTRDDKSFLLEQLQSTRNKLVNDISGLSDEQMNFKPAPDRWSVSECVEHIITAEKSIFEQQQAAVKQPANPEKRKDIKVADTTLIRMMTDRSQKGKAPADMVPKGLYPTANAAVEAFTAQRSQVIDYVESTNDDLRNHVIVSPQGAMDAYQYLLLLNGHSARHTLQLEEVIADPAFPKSN